MPTESSQSDFTISKIWFASELVLARKATSPGLYIFTAASPYLLVASIWVVYTDCSHLCSKQYISSIHLALGVGI